MLTRVRNLLTHGRKLLLRRSYFLRAGSFELLNESCELLKLKRRLYGFAVANCLEMGIGSGIGGAGKAIAGRHL